jgi:hypothetical protein
MMPNPLVDATREERWEVGLPEWMMQQLRAPSSLSWLKEDAKPASMPLGTFALSSMFGHALIALIVDARHKEVIRQYVRTWPELLTAVLREERLTLSESGLLTVVSEPDGRQSKPPAKASAR